MSNANHDDFRQIARDGMELMRQRCWGLFEAHLTAHKLQISRFVEICEDTLTEMPSVTLLIEYIAYATNTDKNYLIRKFIVNFMRQFMSYYKPEAEGVSK